jgi:hypothetical protein
LEQGEWNSCDTFVTSPRTIGRGTRTGAGCPPGIDYNRPTILMRINSAVSTGHRSREWGNGGLRPERRDAEYQPRRYSEGLEADAMAGDSPTWRAAIRSREPLAQQCNVLHQSR